MKKIDNRTRGFTLIEVLITLVVIAIGVLGLAALQGRSHLAAVESAQRAQAVALINDMASRININRANAVDYKTDTPLGTGTATADCTALAVGRARDQCEWSELLKGAAEVRGSNKTGAMIGARGCIAIIQDADPTPTKCKPAIVRITTAWQGLVESSASAFTCAQGLYGDELLRRAVATDVVIGLPKCI